MLQYIKEFGLLAQVIWGINIDQYYVGIVKRYVQDDISAIIVRDAFFYFTIEFRIDKYHYSFAIC